MKQDNSVDINLLNQDERIANFLKGKMTQEEEAIFMSDIKSDQEFRAKAIAMARLVKGLKSVNQQQDIETIDALLTLDQDTVKEIVRDVTKKKTPAISMRTMSLWMSVAACCLFIVWFSIGQYNDRQLINLANDSYDSFDVSSIARGDNSLSESELKLIDLFDNVKRGEDLPATIHNLEICWELSNMEVYNDYTNYSAEIGWNLAMAYLKSGDKEKCQEVLNIIEKQNSDKSLMIDIINTLRSKL